MAGVRHKQRHNLSPPTPTAPVQTRCLRAPKGDGRISGHISRATPEPLGEGVLVLAPICPHDRGGVGVLYKQLEER